MQPPLHPPPRPVCAGCAPKKGEDHNEFAKRKAAATMAAYLGDAKARSQDTIRTAFGDGLRRGDIVAWSGSLPDNLASNEDIKTLDRACYAKFGVDTKKDPNPYTAYEARQAILTYAAYLRDGGAKVTRKDITETLGVPEKSQKNNERTLALLFASPKWVPAADDGRRGGEPAAQFLARQPLSALEEHLDKMQLRKPGRKPMFNDATVATAIAYADKASESGMPMSRDNLSGLLRALGRSIAHHCDDPKERERLLEAKYGRSFVERAQRVAKEMGARLLRGGAPAPGWWWFRLWLSRRRLPRALRSHELCAMLLDAGVDTEFGGQTRDTSDARIANATAEIIAAHHGNVEAEMLKLYKEGDEGARASRPRACVQPRAPCKSTCGAGREERCSERKREAALCAFCSLPPLGLGRREGPDRRQVADAHPEG